MGGCQSLAMWLRKYFLNSVFFIYIVVGSFWVVSQPKDILVPKI